MIVKHMVSFTVDAATMQAIDKARGLIPLARWVRDVAVRNELERAGFPEIAQHMDENPPQVGRPVKNRATSFQGS